MENLTSYRMIQDRIKRASEVAGRVDIPELVAVSKFQSPEKMRALYQEGHRIFGENYVQELIEKKEILKFMDLPDLEFHFIGSLQSNKVKHLLPHVSTIHSVDSIKLHQEIEKQASRLQKRIQIYLQINIDNEASKGGLSPDELRDFLSNRSSGEWLEIKGLMAIPDPEKDPVSAFKRLKTLSQSHQHQMSQGLSIGMSQDFEAAIAEGATSIRIGSALFGLRG